MITNLYPLMPLRDIVIFPYMMVPLLVGRKQSALALEDAMGKKSEIFLVAQRNKDEDNPQQKDLYEWGTLATIVQLLRLPDDTIKVLVEGQRRARIISCLESTIFTQAEVEEYETVFPQESKAYVRMLHNAFDEYSAINHKISKDMRASVELLDNPLKILNTILLNLTITTAEKQSILEQESVSEQVEAVLAIISGEIELYKMEQNINAKVKAKMNKNQRDYFLGEKIREFQSQISQNEEGIDELSALEENIKNKEMPKIAREKTLKEFKKLRSMPAMSAETTVVRNYIDTIISLPWDTKSDAVVDIENAEKILDQNHYGLEKTKERILEYLAVQTQVEKIKGPVLCLVGPPGVGKTSICRSIAKAMGREFSRVALGGVRDEAEIRGHRRTYVGAMPGKIIQTIQKVGVSNPLFCLDEVDKMSTDFRGDPSAALLEVLDPEQNNAFDDHYLDLEYDLSDIFFITTANNLHGIPAPLQDRLEIIFLSGYTEEDKLKIGEGFLLPKQLTENGFKTGDIQLTSGALLEMIRRYTREAGVRNLERIIASLCRKVARERLKRKQKHKKYRISVQNVGKFLGTPQYRYGVAEGSDKVGLTTGLAWTEVGGELLQIEASLLPGSGKLIITGKLGDVMQESAQAALSYVRSRANVLGLEDTFYQKLDIHIHVPEGATPKDGPSAGITMATTLVSALTGLPVKHYLAMTGEITLRGRVLPIGGLTEKLLAARRGGITHVLVPKANEKDLNDVPLKIRKSLEIKTVEHVDSVLKLALVHNEELPFLREKIVKTTKLEQSKKTKR